MLSVRRMKNQHPELWDLVQRSWGDTTARIVADMHDELATRDRLHGQFLLSAAVSICSFFGLMLTGREPLFVLSLIPLILSIMIMIGLYRRMKRWYQVFAMRLQPHLYEAAFRFLGLPCEHTYMSDATIGNFAGHRLKNSPILSLQK